MYQSFRSRSNATRIAVCALALSIVGLLIVTLINEHQGSNEHKQGIVDELPSLNRPKHRIVVLAECGGEKQPVGKTLFELEPMLWLQTTFLRSVRRSCSRLPESLRVRI